MMGIIVRFSGNEGTGMNDSTSWTFGPFDRVKLDYSTMFGIVGPDETCLARYCHSCGAWHLAGTVGNFTHVSITYIEEE